LLGWLGAGTKGVHVEETCSGRRILIIDDEADTGDCLAILLGFSGHLVEVARTGPDGLRIALETEPEVIILDIGLPGMDGYEVAAKLRASALSGDLLIIAYTGFAAKSDRARSQEAGIDFHLAKPGRIQDLVALIDDQRTRSPSAIAPLLGG